MSGRPELGRRALEAAPLQGPFKRGAAWDFRRQARGKCRHGLGTFFHPLSSSCSRTSRHLSSALSALHGVAISWLLARRTADCRPFYFWLTLCCCRSCVKRRRHLFPCVAAALPHHIQTLAVAGILGVDDSRRVSLPTGTIRQKRDQRWDCRRRGLPCAADLENRIGRAKRACGHVVGHDSQESPRGRRICCRTSRSTSHDASHVARGTDGLWKRVG